MKVCKEDGVDNCNGKQFMAKKLWLSWKKKRIMPATIGAHMVVMVFLRLSTKGNVLQ